MSDPFVVVDDPDNPPWGDDRSCPECGEPNLPLLSSDPPMLTFISHCGNSWVRGPLIRPQEGWQDVPRLTDDTPPEPAAAPEPEWTPQDVEIVAQSVVIVDRFAGNPPPGFLSALGDRTYQLYLDGLLSKNPREPK